MNKTAIYALLMAAIVPLLCYFIIKGFSDTATTMPRHFLPDSVINTTRQGKVFKDTVWHKLPDFSLTNQLGEPVSWESVKGKVVVADFFFTHCPTICPRLTDNMRKLQTAITNAQRVGDKTPDFVHFISFSIDPERDSVQELKKWADRFQINPQQWSLLTGSKEVIYNMGIHEMKVPLQDGKGIDTSFFHTDRFILIDTNRHVRGYYNGLDTMELSRISRDIIMLTMEKDPTRKSFLSGKLEIMAVAFIAAILGVGLLIYFIKNKKQHAGSRLEKE